MSCRLRGPPAFWFRQETNAPLSAAMSASSGTITSGWRETGGDPSIELGFEWLDEHWPAREGDPVFSWGDARIGNMMFEDFAPVAVLDWEMASVGPREIDLGWMIYIHRFFQDLVEDLGMPGLPHVLRRTAVAAYYEQLTGYTPQSRLLHPLCRATPRNRDVPDRPPPSDLRRGRDARESRRSNPSSRPPPKHDRGELLGQGRGLLTRRTSRRLFFGPSAGVAADSGGRVRDAAACFREGWI